MLVPDTAHGTNPASATLAGYDSVPVPSGPDGTVDPAEVEKRMDADVAGIMVTNPNTLGLFEGGIGEIARTCAGESGSGLFMLDRELGQRVFTPPASAEA